MKKILILDDDYKLCCLLSSYFLSLNFYVHSVNSVPVALAVIKQDCPDIIISDIMMKDLNGYDFIKLLKLDKEFVHLPVIFLTAKGMTLDRIKGYNLGCHAYLTKPFNPEELNAIISNIFKHIEILEKDSINSNLDSLVCSDIKDFPGLSLTYREQSVLSLIVKGYMNKEIAINLSIGKRNVEKYVTRLLRKTNTRNRSELIKMFVNLS